MFKITEYSELNGKISMTILYTLNCEPVKDERIYDTKENAMRYFASSAHTFLLIQTQAFRKIIMDISKHYLISDSMPFVRDQQWTVNYWKYLDLNRRLSKTMALPHRYATEIFTEIQLLKCLIPELIILQRHELQALLTDIENISKNLIRTIEMIQDGKFSVEPQNIAS